MTRPATDHRPAKGFRSPPMPPVPVARAALVCLLSLLAGCRGVQSALDPRGGFAHELYELSLVMFIGGAVIFGIVMALLVSGLLIKDPPTPARHHDERDRRRGRVVLLGGALTALTVTVLFIYNDVIHRASTRVAPDALQVRVVGHQWWWDVTYPGDPPSETVRTANELHIPVGRDVTVTLESRDVIHSFWVPNLQGKIDAIPGRTNSLTLRADEPGVFRGQCAEFCGLQHAKMAFFVVAHPPEEFARWRAAQLLPAAAATHDTRLERGRRAFLEHGCGLCHTVRGTNAFAAAGPDLTHLASRRSLAAGTLPNTRGNLAAWILDPQHIKPGARMPPMAVDGEELHHMLDFLESLR